MEEKVVIKSKNGMSIIPSIICFGVAILSLIVCFSIADAAYGDPGDAFTEIEDGYWGFFVGTAIFIIAGLTLLLSRKQ